MSQELREEIVKACYAFADQLLPIIEKHYQTAGELLTDEEISDWMDKILASEHHYSILETQNMLRAQLERSEGHVTNLQKQNKILGQYNVELEAELASLTTQANPLLEDLKTIVLPHIADKERRERVVARIKALYQAHYKNYVELDENQKLPSLEAYRAYLQKLAQQTAPQPIQYAQNEETAIILMANLMLATGFRRIKLPKAEGG